MIITTKTDLQFEISNLIDSNGNKIRLKDCSNFVCKFYTTDINNAAICQKTNSETVNIKIEEDRDFCLINSTDLEKMEDGVLFFNIEYAIADELYSDGEFNNSVNGNTSFYIQFGNEAERNPESLYNKDEIDSKFEEVNKQIDNIITGGEIDLTNYYTKKEIDEKGYITSIPDIYITNEELETELSSKVDTTAYTIDKTTFALKSDIPNDYLTESKANETYQLKGNYLTSIPDEYITNEELVSELSNKVDKEEGKKLTSNDFTNEYKLKLDGLSNYNDSEIRSQLAGKLDTTAATATYQPIGDYLTNDDLANYALKSELSNKLDSSAYTNDKATFALKSELESKQDTLVSGTNIKTINSQSLLGNGNIEITVEGGGIADAPNDGKLYGRKSEQWNEIIIPTDYITNEELNEELANKLDTTTYTIDKETFALKSDIPTDYLTNEDLTGYETIEHATATYQPIGDYLTNDDLANYALKTDLNDKLDINTYTTDKATFATKSYLDEKIGNINSVLDTINGEII